MSAEQFIKQFSEWDPKKIAKELFKEWSKQHPAEKEILRLLDTESRHAPFRNNPRRVKLYHEAQETRRSLGLRDELAEVVMQWPATFEEKLAVLTEHTDVTLEEVELARRVVRGWKIRLGWTVEYPPDYLIP